MDRDNGDIHCLRSLQTRLDTKTAVVSVNSQLSCAPMSCKTNEAKKHFRVESTLLFEFEYVSCVSIQR